MTNVILTVSTVVSSGPYGLDRDAAAILGDPGRWPSLSRPRTREGRDVRDQKRYDIANALYWDHQDRVQEGSCVACRANGPCTVLRTALQVMRECAGGRGIVLGPAVGRARVQQCRWGVERP